MSMIGNTPGVSSQRTVLEEVVTGSPKTSFVPTSGYMIGYVDVLVNGVEVDSTDYTAADGVTITLATAAAVGDTVKVKAWLPRGLSDGYLKSEADARYLNLAGGQLTGNLGVGVASSAWASGKAIDVNNAGLFGYSSGGVTGLTLAYNQYFNGTAWKAKATGTSAILQLGGNSFRVFGSDSVAANADVALTSLLFTQKDYTLALQGGASTPGAGIAFPSTQVASSDANTLDDYEEGTWYPTFTGTTTNPTVVYGDQTGRYVKIGKLVYVSIAMFTSSCTSVGSGYLRVSSLPFQVSTSTQGVSLALTAYWVTPPLGAGFVPGTTDIELMQSINNIAQSVSNMQTGTATAINYVRMSGCYITS